MYCRPAKVHCHLLSPKFQEERLIGVFVVVEQLGCSKKKVAHYEECNLLGRNHEFRKAKQVT